MTSLEGKTVLITGGNSGIGKMTAIDLAKRGARVIVASRDASRGEAAVNDVKRESDNDDVILGVLDLASFDSIRKFAAEINGREERLDILINNAGVMACPPSKTVDGLELQMGTNHFGHFLLTLSLLDLLTTSAPSRVVNVSSLAHKQGKIYFDDINLEKSYGPWKAYGQSKLANVLFTRTLHEKLTGTGVTTYAVHPGVIMTNLQRHTSHLGCFIKYCCCCFVKSPHQGASTTLYCALTPGIEQHSGQYFADNRLTTPSREGQDDEVARRLWAVSEDITGAKYSE